MTHRTAQEPRDADAPRGATVAEGTHGAIRYRTARAPMFGAVNGYVRLPDNHPWLAITDLWQIENTVPWGEITYGHGNWIGFDTLHCGQYWPGRPYGPSEGDVLMDEAMVIRWTETLARDAQAALDEATR